MDKNVSKSPLARANQDRDYHILKKYTYYLVSKARQKHVNHIFKLGSNIHAFDSKTKNEIPYKPSSYYIFNQRTFNTNPSNGNVGYPKNVLSDTSILLTGFYPKQYYPEPLRLVKY